MPTAIPASLRRLQKSFSGTLGIAACDLKAGDEIFVNPDVVFPTASMVKIGILLELFRRKEAGQLELSEMRTIKKADKTAGSGLLENMGQV